MPNIDLAYGSFHIRINYAYSQDINANSSYVYVTSVEAFNGNQSTYYVVYLQSGRVTFNGTQVVSFGGGSYFIPISDSSYNAVAGAGYGGVTVWHNADGSSPGISVNAEINYRYEPYQSSSNFYGSGSFGLPTIPRASSISANGVTLGNEMGISISRAAAGFTESVTWRCGSQSGTIADHSGATYHTWTPPRELAEQAPSSGAVPVTLTCYTYSGGSHIGTRSITVNCPIPDDMVPTVSAALSDTKGYTDTFGGYVQNQSQLRVVSTAQGSYGSWIASYAVTCQGLTRNAADCTFGLANSGATEISVTVTDSRGRSASWAGSIDVIPWSIPTAQLISVQRADEHGDLAPTGSFALIKFNGNVAEVGGKNATAYKLMRRLRGTEVWTELAISAYDGQYSPVGAEYLTAASVDSSFEFCIKVSDSFADGLSTIGTIPVAFSLLDFDRRRNAAGILQRASEANTLAIGADTKHYGHRITDVGDPASDTDAATVGYIKSAALTLEEIEASTDLSGKIASAHALKAYVAKAVAVKTVKVSVASGTWSQSYPYESDSIVEFPVANTASIDTTWIFPRTDYAGRVWTVKNNGGVYNTMTVEVIMLKR